MSFNVHKANNIRLRTRIDFDFHHSWNSWTWRIVRSIRRMTIEEVVNCNIVKEIRRNSFATTLQMVSEDIDLNEWYCLNPMMQVSMCIVLNILLLTRNDFDCHHNHRRQNTHNDQLVDCRTIWENMPCKVLTALVGNKPNLYQFEWSLVVRRQQLVNTVVHIRPKFQNCWNCRRCHHRWTTDIDGTWCRNNNAEKPLDQDQLQVIANNGLFQLLKLQ